MNEKWSAKKEEERILLLEKTVKAKRGHHHFANGSPYAHILPLLFFSNRLNHSSKMILLGVTVAFEGAFSKESALQLYSEDFLRLAQNISGFVSKLELIPEAEKRLIDTLIAPLLLLSIGLLSVAQEAAMASPEVKEAPHLRHAPFLELLTRSVITSEFMTTLTKEIGKVVAITEDFFPPLIEAIIWTGALMGFSEKSALPSGLYETISSKIGVLIKKVELFLRKRKSQERDPLLYESIDKSISFFSLVQKSLQEKGPEAFERVIREEMIHHKIRYESINDDLKKMKKQFLALTKTVETSLNTKENVISFIG